MRSVPIHDLKGPACDPEHLFIQSPIELAQALKRHSSGNPDVRFTLCGHARTTFHGPEVLFSQSAEGKRIEAAQQRNSRPMVPALNEKFVP